MIDQLILDNKPSNYLVTSTDLNNRYSMVTTKICSEMDIKEDEILLQYMFNYILKEYADEIENYIFEMDFEIIENN